MDADEHDPTGLDLASEIARAAVEAAEYGVQVSLMAATSFRDSTFARHLQRIGKAAELSKQLREATAGGNSTADAAGRQS